MAGPSNPLSPLGKNPVECNERGRPYFYHVTFVTNSTNAPDGVVPAYSDHAVARSTVGVYTITITTAARPTSVFWGTADVVANTTDVRIAEYRGHAAGVFTVAVGLQNTTTGVYAIADSTDVTVNCIFFCNGNNL